MKYTIGSRGSALALAQSMQVKHVLMKMYPMDTFEVKTIMTTGDIHQQMALTAMQEKGVFVKELEIALLNKQIDLAIHSMKDMPSQLPVGLCLASTILREDARDVLVSSRYHSLQELPLHARIGTGSLRRKAQLLKRRPDLQVEAIRGNIDTRLQKLKDEHLDGIILAAAGLHRLQKQDLICEYMELDDMIPACGQGALAIEIRTTDVALSDSIKSISNSQIAQEVRLERMFLQAVEGGCHAPVGAHCQLRGQQMTFRAVYGNEDGSKLETFRYDGVMDETVPKQAALQLQAMIGRTI